MSALEVSITPGNEVRIDVEFLNEAGEPTDGTVTISVIDPRATRHSLVVIHDSTGKWHAVTTALLPGTWEGRAASTGALVAAVEGRFTVGPSKFV